jgi:transposase
MARASGLQKVQEWRGRMARFAKVRQSVARFCQDEGVSVPSFYQWRKKLKQLRRPMADDDAAVSFTPVRLVAAAGVCVQLPGGTQLQIPTADPQALELVVRTLARADAKRAGGASC